MTNSFKSCFGVLCLLHSCIFALAQPQNKLSISARVDFYSIPVNNPGTDIPYPKYDINGKLGLNQAAYIDLNWRFAKNLGCSFSLGIHNFNYTVDIYVPNYIEGFMPTIDDHRSWKVLGISPTIGLIWKSNKFQTHFCVSNFIPFKIIKSRFHPSYGVHTFNPETEDVHSIVVSEGLYPSNSLSSYNLWQLYFQYSLTDKVGIILGLETTIGKIIGKPYTIKIEEYEDFQIDSKTVANDYGFTYYYSAITFGMSYTFNLKKGNKEKEGETISQ